MPSRMIVCRNSEIKPIRLALHFGGIYEYQRSGIPNRQKLATIPTFDVVKMQSKRVSDWVWYGVISVEPKKHTRVIRWPEIICYPLNKPSVQKRFVEDVNHICCEKRPKKNA